MYNKLVRCFLLHFAVFTLSALASQPVVKAVPAASDTQIPHSVIAGKSTTLKATSSLEGQEIQASWDPGDGGASVMFSVMDRFNVSASHVYVGAPGATFNAKLTVTDGRTGESSSALYRVVIREKTLAVQAAVAVDEGLWYVHRNMTRVSLGVYDGGNWTGKCANVCDGRGTVNAVNLLAFERSGFLPSGSQDNPYTETVSRALNSLLDQASNTSLRNADWADALAAAGQPQAIAPLGPSDISGSTFEQIVAAASVQVDSATALSAVATGTRARDAQRLLAASLARVGTRINDSDTFDVDTKQMLVDRQDPSGFWAGHNPKAQAAFETGQSIRILAGPNAGGASTITNVSSQVSVTNSGFLYNRVARTYSGTMTVTNTSGSTINGPIDVVLTQLTATVSLTNADGSYNGSPYRVATGVASLAPGQQTTISLTFTNPGNLVINFTPVTYSGTFPPGTVSVGCPASTGTNGIPYSSALMGMGGVLPYFYSTSNGSLPNGLTLNSSTGAISGTPSANGPFTFTANLSDGSGSASGSASASCTITISAATTALLLACPSSSAQVGTAYSSALVASGGTSPYTYSITTGTLPPPLTLNTTSGAITGTPNTQSNYTFTASVTDSTPGTAQTTPANCNINVAAASTIPVTVQTSPAGRQFTVDGTTYTATQTLNWTPGSSHTIATTTPQTVSGTQYVFNNWSDGGAISHSVTAPSATTTYTASFDTQYQLTTAASPAAGGTVTPTSGTYFAANSVQTVTATPNSGYVFSSWTGPVVNSSSASTTVTLTGPTSVTANFTATSGITVQTSPVGESFTVDGTTYTTIQTFNWVPGSSHSLSTTSPQGSSGTRFVFNNWSDGGAISHSVTAPGAATTYTANFDTQYQLTTAASPAAGGTVTPASGNYYAANSVQTVTATPNSGYTFSSWTGPVASSSSASTTVTLTGPISITANFTATASITVGTSPVGESFTVDGITYTTTQTFSWVPGSTHSLSTTSPQGSGGTRFVFNNWSDEGAISHSVTAPSVATSYTAAFNTQYQLTTAASPAAGGAVAPTSGNYYAAGSTQTVIETPASGYSFNGWTGPVAISTATSTTVTMTGPISVTANFITALTLTCPSSTAAIGTAYSSSLVASGGTASYTYSIQSGTLPPPLALSSNGLISGTPNTKGTYNFVAKVLDSGAPVQQSATASCSIVVPNRTPTASAQTVSGTEDTAKVISLSGTDPDGDSLTFTIVSSPAHGTLGSLGAPGCSGTSPRVCTSAVTYTPNANYNGSDSFTFKVNDGTVDSSASTVVLTLSAVNDPPTAIAKSYNVMANMQIQIPANIGLLIGAVDPDSGDAGFTSTLTAMINTAATGGTVVVNTDGSFTYEPPAGTTGTFIFTYKVCDNGNPAPSQCSAGTMVTLTVGGPVIYFANVNAANNGTGALSSPFKTLAAANTALGSNTSQRIFLYSGTYASGTGVTLVANDWLVGQGVTGSSFDSVMGISPPTGTIARPAIGGTAPIVQGTISMNASNTEVLGVSIQPPANTAGLVATQAGPFTGLVISDIPIISTSGSRAVDLNNVSGTMTITKVSTSSVGIGINLTALNPSSGSFTVTGSGGVCNPTTTTCTGGTISNANNAGVSLTNAKAVSLSYMRITGGSASNYGLFGTTISNLSLNNVLMDGTAGNGSSTRGQLYVTDWTGTGTISNSDISGSTGNNVQIQNTAAGSLNRLTVSNTTIHDNSTTLGNTGFDFEAPIATSTGGSGVVMNLTVSNCRFTNNRSDHLYTNAAGRAVMDVVLTSNVFTGYTGELGGTVTMIDSDNSSVTFDVNGNTINGALLSSFTFFGAKSSDTSAAGSMVGRFRNNIIGTSGVTGSGSAQGYGVQFHPTGLSTMTVNVTGNTIRQYSQIGLYGLVGDTTAHLNATITGNTIKEPAGTDALQGITITASTTSSDGAVTACADIGGTGALANDVNGSGANGFTDIRVRQRFSSTLKLPGYTGGATDTTAIANYLIARNKTSPTANDSVQSPGTVVGGGACTQAP